MYKLVLKYVLTCSNVTLLLNAVEPSAVAFRFAVLGTLSCLLVRHLPAPHLAYILNDFCSPLTRFSLEYVQSIWQSVVPVSNFLR